MNLAIVEKRRFGKRGRREAKKIPIGQTKHET